MNRLFGDDESKLLRAGVIRWTSATVAVAVVRSSVRTEDAKPSRRQEFAAARLRDVAKG
ncbi:hypothetical protein [Natronococcus wangiae]|uniref:hypothetical protein n=1 Tax=Natronococcus wangiae TaxID=3068275 RepID=UPI00273FDE50|nr:hypothetical protein [Natronococcus sp. AD5]